jgi:glucose/arabinose dehydrogenase
MQWRRVRRPLCLALLAVAAVLLWRSFREVGAVWAELETATLPAAIAATPPAAALPSPARVRLAAVARGLSRPLFVTQPPGEDSRLFVVEQGGTVRIVRGGQLVTTPFLDLTSELDSSAGERGLLGLAFAPDYATSGLFYVAHTAPGPAGVVRRFRVSADPNRADPGSGELVLSMADPAGNHNGGMIAFGPDGYLWIGTGDGGSAGDPWDNAQNPNSLLGKMLRIDVATRPYRIPAGNPWADRPGARPELWAIGLRNPWRFSFDRVTGELWVGDVGQFQWEEIDVEDPRRGGGLNYGWRTLEARHCYSPKSGCDAAGLHLPVYEYGHDRGCSVTGGYVYRGQAIAGLRGHYLFSDYCRGTVWALSRPAEGGAAVALLLESQRSISSFGEDNRGELYLCDHRQGELLRLEAVE